MRHQHQRKAHQRAAERDAHQPTRSTQSRRVQLARARAARAYFGREPVQARADDLAPSPDDVHAIASEGVQGSGGRLPYLDMIQGAFGRHDVTGVRAFEHSDAPTRIGALAYCSGDRIAFSGAADLHTAAHEAAHVVQQRAGVQLRDGIGESGDRYERHADAVADAVVQGRSAEGLLDAMAGPAPTSGALQRKEVEATAATDGEPAEVEHRDKEVAPEVAARIAAAARSLEGYRVQVIPGETPETPRVMVVHPETGVSTPAMPVDEFLAKVDLIGSADESVEVDGEEEVSPEVMALCTQARQRLQGYTVHLQPGDDPEHPRVLVTHPETGVMSRLMHLDALLTNLDAVKRELDMVSASVREERAMPEDTVLMYVNTETRWEGGDGAPMALRFDCNLGDAGATAYIPGVGVVKVGMHLRGKLVFKKGSADSTTTLRAGAGNPFDAKAIEHKIKSQLGSTTLRFDPSKAALTINLTPIGPMSLSGSMQVNPGGWSMTASVPNSALKMDFSSVGPASGAIWGQVTLSQSWQDCDAPKLLAAYQAARATSGAVERFTDWVARQDPVEIRTYIVGGVGSFLLAGIAVTVAPVAGAALTGAMGETGVVVGGALATAAN